LGLQHVLGFESFHAEEQGEIKLLVKLGEREGGK
jgi:hypothetical protein